MISWDKCSGSCNVVPSKIGVLKKTKDLNFKAFNLITNKNEAKAMKKHISCDCECKLKSSTCNWNQKWNNETCQWECKSYDKCKRDYSWNPSTCIYKSSKYLKR